ncbi:MAG: DUF1131 family protein [Bacteroidia bacterium]
MKIKISLLILTVITTTFSCKRTQTELTESEKRKMDSLVMSEIDSLKNDSIDNELTNDNLEDTEKKTDVQTIEKIKLETITLFEDSINGLSLPFSNDVTLADIDFAFNELKVFKEIGMQDGPDFPLYSVKNGNDVILYFFMDWEDTLKLTDVVALDSAFKDEYGLTIGNSYTDIKNKRPNVKAYTDYHQHTYVYDDNSNIRYEIYGKATIPENADMENLVFTEDEMKDWKIERIIWKNK